LPVLIATTIFDEGVDVSGINCLFLAAGGKSMRQLLQRIGRGLRKKSDGSCIEVYDDVLDYHNEHLTRHTLGTV
jgi:superfamily II DNA or RNA helicase